MRACSRTSLRIPWSRWRAGVPVHDITPWLFGGVSQLGGEAAGAEDLLRIAVAGPLMSVAVGLGFAALAVLIAVAGGPDLLVISCGWLGGINLFLAPFNLAPACCSTADGSSLRSCGATMVTVCGRR